VGGLDFLVDELGALEGRDLLRIARSRDELPPGCVLLCTNDYLGFAGRRSSVTAPAGAGASALVWGYGEHHAAAELALARFTGAQACLLFTSGYAVNVGVIAALAGPGDVVVSDALNHASLIDGCRLSGARIAVTTHLDVDHVARALEVPARRRFVVTESLFSMDGDGPDLGALRAVCDRAGAALILDEAHALGVVGPGGRGRAAEAGIVPDVLVGMLGKAFGLQGGFACGSRALRSWLWNRARSFVFSTAIAPALAAAVPGRVAEVAAADQARDHLRRMAALLRDELERHLGVRPGGGGAIVPIVVGAARDAVAASRALLEEGWVVQAIRPPTVPEGTSRLRVTLRADLDADAVRAAAAAIGRTVVAARRPR
jgi:8-amino-7-oxononanoate synthase